MRYLKGMHESYFLNYLKASTEVILKLKVLEPEINQLCEFAVSCLKSGGKIFFCGNGGSASDAQHLAAELVGRFAKNRHAIAAISLNTDTSVITSIANDFGYEFIFSRQLEALSRPGDLLVAISTSGSSKNIIEGIKTASKLGLKIAFFTSENFNQDIQIDYLVKVPSRTTSHIQEAHILIGQAFCGYLEKELT